MALNIAEKQAKLDDIEAHNFMAYLVIDCDGELEIDGTFSLDELKQIVQIMEE